MLSRHPKMSNNRQMGRFLPGQRKPLMAMVEITNSCNMTCPICFSDANGSPSNVPIHEIQRRLEQLLEVTETPKVQSALGQLFQFRKLPFIRACPRCLDRARSQTAKKDRKG